jgi:hypothetical protein
VGPRTVAVIAVHLYGRWTTLTSYRRWRPATGWRRWRTPRRPTALDSPVDGRGAWESPPGSASIRERTSEPVGNGGAVVSNDADLLRRVRRHADHGRFPPQRDHHQVIGRNSRLDSFAGRPAQGEAARTGRGQDGPARTGRPIPAPACRNGAHPPRTRPPMRSTIWRSYRHRTGRPQPVRSTPPVSDGACTIRYRPPSTDFCGAWSRNRFVVRDRIGRSTRSLRAVCPTLGLGAVDRVFDVLRRVG